MSKRSQRGFTIIEATVVISAILLLAALVMPEHIRSRDATREDEVKANLHGVQVALERYGSDHDRCYPNYIIGGDEHGWDSRLGCRAVTMGAMNYMQPPRDSLIEYGYLASYPRNPFIQPGDGMNTTIWLTGASNKLGDGDVRFGWDGECMGNCLDDPRFLFDSGSPTRLQNTMWPIPSAYLGVVNYNSPNTFYTMGGMPQWSGENWGASDPEAGVLRYWWPGEFFYRAGGVFAEPDPRNPYSEPGDTIWTWPYAAVDKYMLGAYGSLRTEGLDVIRLTAKDGRAACAMSGATNGTIYGEFYQDNSDPAREASHPEFDMRVQYSNPEVFGGGAKGLMPQFPYYERVSHKWIYGAPDGYPDGIILVLTNEDWPPG